LSVFIYFHTHIVIIKILDHCTNDDWSKYQHIGLATETMLPKFEDFTPEEHHAVQREMLEEHISELRKNIKSPFTILERIERTLWETPKTTCHRGNEDHLRCYSPGSGLTIYNMAWKTDQCDKYVYDDDSLDMWTSCRSNSPFKTPRLKRWPPPSPVCDSKITDTECIQGHNISLHWHFIYFLYHFQTCYTSFCIFLYF
jgi:hypothetical protein